MSYLFAFPFQPVALLVIPIPPSYSFCIHAHATSVSVHHPTIPQRRELVERWLSAARDIADRTKDREALRLADFLESRVVVGLPRPSNDVSYAPRRSVIKSDAVIVIPVLGGDYWLLPPDDYWRQFGALHIAERQRAPRAEYYPPTRAIYIPAASPYPDMQQGLVLLHEGMHAYDRLVRGERMPHPFWRRERNAQLMEMRLLKLLGGSKFVNYLDQLVPEVERQVTATKPFTLRLPAQLIHNELLDQVLWPTTTQPHRWQRTQDLERCAVAHFFEKRYGKHGLLIRYGRYIRDNYIAQAHPQHLAGL